MNIEAYPMAKMGREPLREMPAGNNTPLPFLCSLRFDAPFPVTSRFSSTLRAEQKIFQPPASQTFAKAPTAIVSFSSIGIIYLHYSYY
jgi:hypothetical protein